MKRNNQNPKQNFAKKLKTSLQQQNVKNGKGRLWTLSIAFPENFMSINKAKLQTTSLLGQLARTAALFCVDEIVVFKDPRTTTTEKDQKNGKQHKPPTPFFPAEKISLILSYLSCPQYIRKHLFPIDEDLKSVGTLPPLELPSHPRLQDHTPYREGFILRSKKDQIIIDVGLEQTIKLTCNTSKPKGRITMKMQYSKDYSTPHTGEICSSSEPTEKHGIYWGYQVRIAADFEKIFSESPYEGGYDFKIGTSELGRNVDEISDSEFKTFKHLIVIFGGTRGLESISGKDVNSIFDVYVNTCVPQGTLLIHTPEAMLISLSILRPIFENKGFSEN